MKSISYWNRTTVAFVILLTEQSGSMQDYFKAETVVVNIKNGIYGALLSYYTW